MQIIVISGRAQHGKDTVAKMLEHHLKAFGKNVLITHYADLLKYICKAYFNWDGIKDERGRQLLQYVGTDVVRNINPEFWVDFVSTMLKWFGTKEIVEGEKGDRWNYVIIPDTRFPNEIERLKNDGHTVIHLRVNRPDCENGLTNEQCKHISENALDDTPPDVVIINNGTLRELDKAIIRYCSDELLRDDGKFAPRLMRDMSPLIYYCRRRTFNE